MGLPGVRRGEHHVVTRPRRGLSCVNHMGGVLLRGHGGRHRHAEARYALVTDVESEGPYKML